MYKDLWLLSIHFLNCLFDLGLWGDPELIPAVIVQEADYTLDRSSVYQGANAVRVSLVWWRKYMTQRRLAQGQHANASLKGFDFKSRTLLLWGDNHSTVSTSQAAYETNQRCFIALTEQQMVPEWKLNTGL